MILSIFVPHLKNRLPTKRNCLIFIYYFHENDIKRKRATLRAFASGIQKRKITKTEIFSNEKRRYTFLNSFIFLTQSIIFFSIKILFSLVSNLY
jgi:hypothetical protein